MYTPQPRRVNLRGIIVKDGKLFCQQIKNNHSNTKEQFWCTPGGGIDFGESLHEGLTREIIEETGVTPVIGNLLFIQQFHDGSKEQLEFFFHIKNADDYETIDLTATSHGLEEIERCGFIKPITHHILPRFLSEIHLQDTLSHSSPVPILSEL